MLFVYAFLFAKVTKRLRNTSKKASEKLVYFLEKPYFRNQNIKRREKWN